jgi:hypothetical protein
MIEPCIPTRAVNPPAGLQWIAAGAVHLVTPSAGPKPKRVEILADFLAEKLAPHGKHRTRAVPPSGKAKR